MASKTRKKTNVSYGAMQKQDLLAAKAAAKSKSNAKDAKPGKTSAFDDALGLLLSTVHVGRLKNLPKENYGEELKRVRVLQRVVAKAVAEGNAAPAVGRSLARHFDALIEGL